MIFHSDDRAPSAAEVSWRVGTAIAACRCRTASTFMNGPLWMNFARAQDSEWMLHGLLDAIHGAGAFRMFRSTIRRLAYKSWPHFREETLAEIAQLTLGTQAPVPVASHT